MRKIKLFIASSLDGYIAKEDENTSCLFSDDDYGYKKFMINRYCYHGKKNIRKRFKIRRIPI
jgi:hypothetical protein